MQYSGSQLAVAADLVQPQYTDSRMPRIEYDVIIVGGGGSGLAAAARCAELGLSVVVLEKRPQPGGTTGIAVGSFTANRTKYQQRQGIDDSVDKHAVDAGKFASPEIEQRNHDALRRYFLSETATTLNWLTEMGLVFHGPSPEPPNRVPRMHNVVRAYFTTTEGGAAITERMEVLDGDNRSIRGLYAIGQNGLGGQILWGHGLHIAWAITSGRLVAEHLAEYRDTQQH